jgi:hypothetical protein
MDISVTVPFATDVTRLIPTITHTGKSISTASTPPDFTNPVDYTVTAANGTTKVWTVTVTMTPGTTIAAITSYLGSVSSAPSNPVPLPVSIDLADSSGNGWGDLLTAIGSTYVSLDLSASDITNMTATAGEFDPGSTGGGTIVSLVLPGTAPNAATSVKAGTSSNPTFKNFTALTQVSGQNVVTIGDLAFAGCTTLATVDLPEATGIGAGAFAGTALATVDLPKALTIGNNAFEGCTALAVDLPEAITIGQSAFYGCTDLFTVDLPKVVTIGNYAFYGCTDLATVDLPKATTIGDAAFEDCTALTTVDLSAATQIGQLAFRNTGTTTLTITLGTTAPALGTGMFNGVTTPKNVTVEVPSGATGYGTVPGTYTGSDTTNNWGNAFRGMGWDGSSYQSGTVNSNISLTIKNLP